MESKLKLLWDKLAISPANHTAYHIFCLIRDKELTHARCLYRNDGDKCWDFRAEIESIIGCRLHHELNCNQPSCQRKE